MASTSFVSARRLVLAAVVVVFLSMTTALPMKDVVGKAMQNAKIEQQQKQQQLHREKRKVPKIACPEPSNLQEMFQQINSDVTQTKFLASAIGGKAYGVPNVTQTNSTQNASGNTSLAVPTDGPKITPGDNDTVCPKTLTHDGKASLDHRSLCPYYYDILELPTGYYPSSLKWAQCKCDRCVENGAFGCEPVKTRIAVLKPVGCFQGMQKYEETRINVTTSCACAFTASVAVNGPTTATASSSVSITWAH